MGIKQHKQAIIEFCSTDTWRNVCAFTFNMKQKVRLRNAHFKNIIFDWYILDELRCKQCFKEFMRDLNRRIYKSAYIKKKKRLNTIPILEKDECGRFHIHAAIEAPHFMTQDEFCKFAMDIWLEQYFGYGHGDAQTNANRGWLDYMAKIRSKNVFDHYLDCLIIDAFHNNKTAFA